MKCQKSCGPRLGKLVHQLPRVITFAYDICFRHMIARLKGIIEEIHFGGSIMPSTIIVIQVDIGGHPPFLTGSKQFSGNFGNLLFLAGFNFRGHFEGLNEGFSR